MTTEEQAAMRLATYGSGTGMPLDDHRSILTTIVVARAAGGRLDNDTLVIKPADIQKVLDHAGMSRG